MTLADFFVKATRSERIQRTECPRCNGAIDFASGAGSLAEGSLCICVFCEAVLQYQKDWTFRQMTDAETGAFSDKDLMHMMDTIQETRRFRKFLMSFTNLENEDSK